MKKKEFKCFELKTILFEDEDVIRTSIWQPDVDITGGDNTSTPTSDWGGEVETPIV